MGMVRRCDGIYVNRFPVERARDRYISCGEASGLVLRLQLVDVMLDSQPILRAFPHTQAHTLFVGRHIFRHLAVRSAMSVGDEASPRLLRPAILSSA
jgi:hypothetical protein